MADFAHDLLTSGSCEQFPQTNPSHAMSDKPYSWTVHLQCFTCKGILLMIIVFNGNGYHIIT